MMSPRSHTGFSLGAITIALVAAAGVFLSPSVGDSLLGQAAVNDAIFDFSINLPSSVQYGTPFTAVVTIKNNTQVDFTNIALDVSDILDAGPKNFPPAPGCGLGGGLSIPGLIGSPDNMISCAPVVLNAGQTKTFSFQLENLPRLQNCVPVTVQEVGARILFPEMAVIPPQRIVKAPITFTCAPGTTAGGGGGSSAPAVSSSCSSAGQAISGIYTLVSGGGDLFALNQANTTAYCNAGDLLLSGAGATPRCSNGSSPVCSSSPLSPQMYYEADGPVTNLNAQGWRSYYARNGDAFYDTVRTEVTCGPGGALAPYFSTYTRTAGGMSNLYAVNQDQTAAYCDAGDTAIHGAGTNVYCDKPGDGGCAVQYLEFNGRIVNAGREGWVTYYAADADAYYDTIQTTVVCLKKTALFDQNLKVYHVVSTSNDYYSINQDKSVVMCNPGDIAIGGGGNPAYCDSGNPVCGRITYKEKDQRIIDTVNQGWTVGFDQTTGGGYDTQRVEVTCIGLADSCFGGGNQQCNRDGICSPGESSSCADCLASTSSATGGISSVGGATGGGSSASGASNSSGTSVVNSCPMTCGDGVVALPEQCDHGSKNGTAGDTCTLTCKICKACTANQQTICRSQGLACQQSSAQGGYVCQGLCGNGNLDPGEQCDGGSACGGGCCDDTCKINLQCASCMMSSSSSTSSR